MSLSRSLQYLFLAIIVTTVGFSLYQWNASRASTQKTAPNNGLVGYWSFDENTGTQAGDGSGNNNTGTLTNGPTWTTGKLGQAINFDGVDDSVRVASLDNASFPTSGTLSFWIKASTMGTDAGKILDVYDGARDHIFIRFCSSGNGSCNGASSGNRQIQVVFQKSDNTYKYNAINTFSENTWVYMTVVWDTVNDTGRVYQNGVQITSGAISDSTWTPSSQTATFGGSNFPGILDDIRIYNRILSNTEITNLYNLGSAKLNTTPITNLTSGLVGYWTFDGKDTPWSSSSAGTATDRSGNSNTGTLTNMSRTTSPAEGKIGQALNFDGADDYIDVPNIAFAGEFTFSGWFRASTPAQSGDSFGEDSGDSGSGPKIILYNGGATFIRIISSSDSSVTLPSAREWFLFTISRNSANKVDVYINAAAPTRLFSDIAQLGTYTLDKIGTTGTPATSQSFKGDIDDVRVYNRALSAGEIQSLYDLGASDKVNSSVSQNQGTGRLDSGLVGYWKLDDASGTTATDSSVNANNGTLTNGPTWGTGKIGGDVVFDGTNDYIDLGNRSVLNLTNNFSVSLWVNINNITQAGYKRFFGGDDINGTTRPVYMEYDYTANQYRVVWQNGGTYGSIAGKTLTAVQWQHFVITFKDGILKSYSDGVPISTSSGVVSPPSNAVSSYIGGTAGGGAFPGSIDEVRVYNRALSDDEVSQLYRLTAPTAVDTSLRGYWSFDGKATNWTSSSAGTVSDLSGSGNTGTLTNMSRTTSPAEGKLGQALNFNYTSSYVNLGTPASLDLRTQNSVAAWVKTDKAQADISGSSSQVIYASGAADCCGTDYMLYLEKSDGGGYYKFRYILTDLGQYILSSSTVQKDRWYHVVGTFDGTTGRLYVDGVLNSSAPQSSPLTDRNNQVYIGRGISGTNSFSGIIDEVRIYNRALSATEISALYNSGR